MATLTIIGYEQETQCEHCGKPLKHGIKTAEIGVIGADCFVKMVDRRLHAVSSSTIRDLAKWREYASEAKRLNNGMRPDVFIFTRR